MAQNKRVHCIGYVYLYHIRRNKIYICLIPTYIDSASPNCVMYVIVFTCTKVVSKPLCLIQPIYHSEHLVRYVDHVKASFTYKLYDHSQWRSRGYCRPGPNIYIMKKKIVFIKTNSNSKLLPL
jgi:hypothetical protein